MGRAAVISAAKPELVAVDTVVFVYAFEMHPEFGAVAAGHLKRIESGVAAGVVSSVVLTELLPPYFARGTLAAARAIERTIVRIPNLTVWDVTRPVAVEAARLRSLYKLRTPDALHAATALVAGAKIFLTNDLRLERLDKEGLQIRKL